MRKIIIGIVLLHLLLGIDVYARSISSAPVTSGATAPPTIDGSGIIMPYTPEEWNNYGIILKIARVDSFNNDIWQIKIQTSGGKIVVYSLAQQSKINGLIYENGYYNGVEYDLDSIVPTNVPVKYIGNTNGNITEIYFDNTSKNYINATFNTEKNQFQAQDVQIPSSPVFCSDLSGNKVFLTPLDAQHKYIIDVYTYGIIVRDYNAINKAYTLKKITSSQNTTQNTTETTDEITTEYYYEITLNFECEAKEDAFLKYKILNSSLETIEEKVLDYELFNSENGAYNFKIKIRKNKTEQYFLKVWLQDKNENEITPEYSLEYKIVATNDKVLKYNTGIILQIGKVEYSDFWHITVQNADADIVVYTVSLQPKINGKTYQNGYYNGEEWNLDAIVPKNVPVKYIANANGEVLRISFDQEIKLELKEKSIIENNLNLKLTITNFTSESMENMVFVCLYRKEGGTHITSDFSSIKPLNEKEVSFSFNSISKDDILKIFLWDENISPYINSKEYTIENLLIS